MKIFAPLLILAWLSPISAIASQECEGTPLLTAVETIREERKDDVSEVWHTSNIAFTDSLKHELTKLASRCESTIRNYSTLEDNISAQDMAAAIRLIAFYTELPSIVKAYIRILEQSDITVDIPPWRKDGRLGEAALYRRMLWESDALADAGLQLSDNSTLVHLNEREFNKANLPTSDSYIIVVTSPMCNPSRRFHDHLERSHDLKSIFDKNSLWLNSPSGRFYPEKSIELEAQIAPNRITYLNPYGEDNYEFTALLDLDLSSYPVFYFVQNGQVQAKLVGWPNGGRSDELRQGMKMIGLLD